VQVQHVGNIHLVTGDWGLGHRYPPAKLLMEIFKQVTKSYYDFPNLSIP
jgi:hypothetical protein